MVAVSLTFQEVISVFSNWTYQQPVQLEIYKKNVWEICI